MNVLYMHGFGSSGATKTAVIMKEELAGITDVISPDFPVLPDEAAAIARENIEKHNIGIIVASSYSGFVLAGMDEDLYRIYINPCMYPSREIPKTDIQISAEQYQECLRLESVITARLAALDKTKSCGIFSTNDELFSYKDEFSPYLGTVLTVEDPHRLSEENLRNILIPAIKDILNSKKSL